MNTTSVQNQLVSEITEAVSEPFRILLGDNTGKTITTRLKTVQGHLEAVLTAGGEDGRECAQAIVALLWRGHIPPQWWSTPLGLLVGQLLDDAPITQFEAAAILNVQQGTIATLLKRGALTRSDIPRPDEWMGPKNAQPVSRASVLARLNRNSSLT